MKYPQKLRLGQKRTISDQEQANNASVSVEQTNIEGKFVQNAWPNVPHLVTSVEYLERVLNKSNIDITNTYQCREGLIWRLVQHNSYDRVW